jgi:hypothetical protein
VALYEQAERALSFNLARWRTAGLLEELPLLPLAPPAPDPARSVKLPYPVPLPRDDLDEQEL